MDRAAVRNRLLESTRWKDFFRSVAVSLQVNLTLLVDDGSYLMCTPEVCQNHNYRYTTLSEDDKTKFSDMCKNAIFGKKFTSCDGSIAVLLELKNKIFIVVCEYNPISEFKGSTLEQKANSAQKLLNSFLSTLGGEIEGGERAVELSALRQINHIVISMFHGQGKTLEHALDLILSALIIMLDVKGSWLEYREGDKVRLIVKGDEKLIEAYMHEKIGQSVTAEVRNGNVYGTLGVLLPEDRIKASYLLPSMAQECLIAFEIEHLFQLMESQQTRILSSIGSSVLLFDQYDQICYVNSAAEKLLGCKSFELIGQPAGTINSPWTSSIIDRVEHHVNGTMDRIVCNGEDKRVDWQICPIREESGIAGRLVIADDRTDYYLWLEIGKKAERMATTTTIIGAFAHELRNPISAAKGFVQLMGQKRDPQKIVGYTDIVLQELDRVTCLINEFILLGKPAEISTEPLNLTSFMQEIMPILTNEAFGTGIEMTSNIEMGPPILADPGQLTHVLLNLVRNSIEAAGNNGHVHMNIISNGNWVELSVRDNGPGIAIGVMDRLFEPFFTTKERGKGLGLSIAQAIVNNHSGYITASNAPDGGAIFTVYLPANGLSLDARNQVDVMIAVADDIIRNTIEQVLHIGGIHTLSAKDLAAAFSTQQYYYPKLLIFDSLFVNIDSIKYTREIWPHIKLLALGELIEQYSEQGIEYISLPIEYSKLVSKIRSMIYS